jgi:hypothetical protein
LCVVKSAASTIYRLCLLLLGLERWEHGSRLILIFIRVVVVIIDPSILIRTVRLRIILNGTTSSFIIVIYFSFFFLDREYLLESGSCRCSGCIGFPAFAVSLYECLQLSKVVDDMDATASVEFRWLEEPEVKTGEVTKGHGVPEEVLL